MFTGSYVALITPMNQDGSIDEAALRQLVNFHIENSTDGIVPVGTTGESPVLSMQEHCRAIEIVVDEAKGNIQVIAGCGSNNTAEAIQFHSHAFSAGANAALHVTGYYNRPSQKGIFKHFEAVSAENSLPIVVYNIPHRAVVNISLDTLYKLSQLPTVVGVKDSTQDLTRPTLERLKIGNCFSLLSGEDATAVPYNVAGGNGCISVAANVVPRLCARLQHACLDDDYKQAMELHKMLMPLYQALTLEPSPAGIKYACSRIGLCQETTRLPMIELGAETKREIDKVLETLNF